MRVHLSSLGCKLNQSEIDVLVERLEEGGHEIVRSPAEADVCILNTCAVTHVAAQKSRQALRRLYRQNPRARLIATGCYAEIAPAALQGLPGVEWVIGNSDKEDRIVTGLFLLNSGRSGGQREAISPSRSTGPRIVDAHQHPRTRALVKIQDGCDNTCTYCVIRLARGPQRSRPADEVVKEVQARLAAGYREIVLTGVHIGAYGRDRSRPQAGLDLWGLVGRLLAETDVPRLRLSSVEPWDLSPEAFPLWGDGRLCRHLHVPLQSGCDATLARMGRRYTVAGFASLIAKARAALPDLAVTTDVIAGFPGETEDEFDQSLSAVQAMQFSRVHVFPYSPRPGTAAAAMPDQVPPAVRKERAEALRAAGAAGEHAFALGFVGRTMQVLWESSRATSGGGRLWSGLTGNYLRAFAVHPGDLRNRLTPTLLEGLVKGGVQGRVVE